MPSQEMDVIRKDKGRNAARASAPRRIMSAMALGAGLGLLAVASGASASGLDCDEGLKQAFKPDAQTTVVEVRPVAAGEALGRSFDGRSIAASAPLCLVKLNVGPGHAGPADAPSTAAGIGIEIWLPAKARWNNRIHALGGGGWQGGAAGVAGKIADPAAGDIAANEGAVTSTTDTGHTVGNGSFAMTPDGQINTTLWTDFAVRAVHEQAVKTKALTSAYYGRAAQKAYWDGGSTGGRQGLRLAQEHPDDFDGIVALYPAINWTRFITAELYPQVVYQRDLNGAPLSTAQLDLVSRAAIAACDSVGGVHLGYIPDPARCAYDPTKDAAVLCDPAKPQGAVCLTPVQALAVNKIWYGPTRDGSVPDPAVDNGWPKAWPKTAFGAGAHRWFGPSRGTTLYTPWFRGLAHPDGPFPIATDVVALELEDATFAEPSFVNAKANGQSRWKTLGYGQLSDALDRGVALQDKFGRINSDNPDLSAFKRRGGKLMTWHATADELIPAQGTVNYYNRVIAGAGGLAQVQDFYRLYLVPGLGHGSPNGSANPDALVPNFTPTQMYQLLTAWVEKGEAPQSVALSVNRGDQTAGGLICPYPAASQYVSGDPRQAASYRCAAQ
jgi:feruloyl esterase